MFVLSFEFEEVQIIYMIKNNFNNLSSYATIFDSPINLYRYTFNIFHQTSCDINVDNCNKIHFNFAL